MQKYLPTNIDLQKKYEDLIILTSDVSTSAGLDRFKNQFKTKKYRQFTIKEKDSEPVKYIESFDVFYYFFQTFQNSNYIKKSQRRSYHCLHFKKIHCRFSQSTKTN